MTSEEFEDPEDLVSLEERNQMLFASIGLPIARMVYLGEFDPETVTRAELAKALTSLGNTRDDAFEIYLTQIEEEIPLVAHCISQERFSSAVVLLFTLFEAEVNSLIRLLMRVRDFSSSKITDALKGTSFDTKLDVILPLLEVEIPDRFRNSALQCRSIRNVVVHNKATPALMADTGVQNSDREIADARAKNFFFENSIDRLKDDLKDFFEISLNRDPSVQWSARLFEKYFKANE
ncbi:hypothetical protein ACLBKS_02810 [Hylemonella sp. W303a]|uniref:hypothetical protein n=1 Tax=Hylemonella sp. W303a TaxID=3389873 RepID=UPI00396B463B